MGTPRRLSCTTNQSDCASPLFEQADSERRQMKSVSGIFAQLSDKKPSAAKKILFSLTDDRDIYSDDLRQATIPFPPAN